MTFDVRMGVDLFTAKTQGRKGPQRNAYKRKTKTLAPSLRLSVFAVKKASPDPVV
jgi:hypothetical protein